MIAALAIVLGLAAPADAQRRKKKPRRAKPAAEQPAAPAEAAPAPGIDVPGAAAPEGTGPGAEGAGKGAGKGTGEKKGKDQVFDFTGLALAGSMRMPQLLYFLDRAEEELERASLERRSFVPALVNSIEEEAL